MAEPRDHYLGLRLSAAEKLAVQEWAEEEKRSASDMARLLIGEALDARRTADQPGRSQGRPMRETVRTTEGRPVRSTRPDCPAEGFTPQKPRSPRCVCGLTQKHHRPEERHP